MYRILVCGDMADALSALKKQLTEAGYQTEVSKNARGTMELLEKKEIHLVIIDVKKPMDDGVEILCALRRRFRVPVILLLAEAEDEDVIRSLDAGADDCVAKPYAFPVLSARVRSQLRRYLTLGYGRDGEGQIRIGGICLDDSTKTVTVEGKRASLTPLEYDILHLLMLNPGKVFSSKEIYRLVWKERPMGAENAVAVHIRHIREKIETDPAAPEYLKVAWGKGYKFQHE